MPNIIVTRFLFSEDISRQTLKPIYLVWTGYEGVVILACANLELMQVMNLRYINDIYALTSFVFITDELSKAVHDSKPESLGNL